MSRSTVTLNQISNVVCSLSCEGFTHVNFADKIVHGVHHSVKLSHDYEKVEFIMDDESFIFSYYEKGMPICSLGEMPLTLVVWNESEKKWNLYTTDETIESFLKLTIAKHHILKEEEKINAILADLQND